MTRTRNRHPAPQGLRPDAEPFYGRETDPSCAEHARVAYQPRKKGKRGSGEELEHMLRRAIG